MKCKVGQILTTLTDRGDLKDFIAAYVCKNEGDFFSTLVATILSQNSTDRAAFKAYENLKKSLGSVTPQKIIEVDFEKIKEAIRVAGLHESKARAIKDLAFELIEGGLSDLIATKDCKRIRERLLAIRGIGEKTADVFLLTCLACEVFPSDTHIKRIFSRLENRRMSYREISNVVLSELNEPDKLLELHHKLIMHGRKVCRAKMPLCEECRLRECCEYYEAHVYGSKGVNTT